MPIITSPVNLHVSSPDGIYSCYLAAGVPSEVPPVLVPHVEYALLQRGASVPPATASKEVQEPDGVDPALRAEKLAKIIAAYKDILAAGDPELLEAGGIPRISEVEGRVGFRTNKKDRDEAWAEVEG